MVTIASKHFIIRPESRRSLLSDCNNGHPH